MDIQDPWEFNHIQAIPLKYGVTKRSLGVGTPSILYLLQASLQCSKYREDIVVFINLS